MKNLKIYGERNSGTIYLEWLLKGNFDVNIDTTPQLGWKHRLAPLGEDLEEHHKNETYFVCLIKNPYSWVLSMHKRPYHHEELRKLSFTDFLTYSYGDYRNPVDMWNIKNNSYLNLEKDVTHFTMVKYEDLLVNMKDVLLGISQKFDFPVPVLFKNINSLITNSHGIKNQIFHRDFYVEEKWKHSIMPRHAKIINANLNPELMKKFNYEYL